MVFNATFNNISVISAALNLRGGVRFYGVIMVSDVIRQ